MERTFDEIGISARDYAEPVLIGAVNRVEILDDFIRLIIGLNTGSLSHFECELPSVVLVMGRILERVDGIGRENASRDGVKTDGRDKLFRVEQVHHGLDFWFAGRSSTSIPVMAGISRRSFFAGCPPLQGIIPVDIDTGAEGDIVGMISIIGGRRILSARFFGE